MLAVTIAIAPCAAIAQAVTLSGKLQIGFGDATNITGFRSNNAVPICAGAGSLVNPATIGTTLGTLLVNAIGDAAPGVGATVTFNAVGAGFGGAQQKIDSTCKVSIPGFANPRLRSRTQVGSAHFPGRKGPWQPSIENVPVPTTPTATYRVSAGGGYTAPISLTTWTTMDEAGPPGTMGTPAVVATNTYTGSAFEALSVWGGSSIKARVQPGGARFGGGVPFSGGGGVQLGVNTTWWATAGTQPPPGLGDYGIGNYSNGFIPVRPQFIGTDERRLDGSFGGTASTPPPFTKGLVFARRDATYAFRTPGGSTQNQHGAILTVNGGNTVTPMSGPFPNNTPVVTPIEYVLYNYAWTTGAVTHSDSAGDFRTVRKAQGYDVAVAPSTAIAGETRRIQLVTPWSASIKSVGNFGVPIPSLGFGGVAVLTIDVIPAPEPVLAGGLGASSLALAALARRRRSLRP